MHDGKVVVIGGDVDDDVGDSEWRIGAEPQVVGSVRYEPVNRVGIAAVSYTHLTLPTKRIV